MKPLKNYESAKAYTELEKLPAGGYVVKILNVEYVDNSDKGYNDTIILSFDIVEGEYKDFYRKQYSEQQSEDKKWKGTYRMRVPLDDGSEKDGWTTRRFKTDITAFESSNSGFAWAWKEQSLKGKLVGAVFNDKEYEFNGRSGFFTNCHHLIDAAKIREGKFKTPATQYLSKESQEKNEEWMNIPDGVEDDALPFN